MRFQMARAKYSVMLNRDVETSIGHLVVMSASGDTSSIDAPTIFVQKAGARAFKTKKAAIAFQSAQRSAHGFDVCGEIIKN